MKLIYFTSTKGSVGMLNRVTAIDKAMPTIRMSLFTDLKSLKRDVQVPPRNFMAAIFEVNDPQTLIELVQLREFFSDRRVVLIVPDYSYQALIYAAKLSPQLIISVSEGSGAIVSVLRKWLEMENLEVV